MWPNATTRFTQNWLVNRGTVRLLLLTGFVGWLAACEEPKEIGLPPTTPVGVLFTDTLTIRTSTVLLDSVQTDRATRLLVGRYNDPALGRVTARAFTQLVVNRDSLKLPSDAILDSMTVRLAYTYAYGDTSTVQTFTVHRLTEDLDTNKRYTNTSSAAFSVAPLATVRVRSFPTSGFMSARVSDDVAQEIFALAKGAGVTETALRQQFKGLAFAPSANNTAVIGFDSRTIGGQILSGLVLYYHRPNQTTVTTEGIYINSFTDRHSAFSQITSDRTGTRLAGLSSTRPLASSAIGGESYVQGGTGVTTRIDFPTLLDLRKQGRIAVNRAELTITVAESGAMGPSPFLAMGAVDDNNRLRYSDVREYGNITRYFDLLPRDLLNIGPAATPAERFANPQVVAYNSRTRTYTFQVSSYLQRVLTDAVPNQGLVLVPSSSNGLTTNISIRLQPIPVYAGELYLNNLINSAVFRGNNSVKLVLFYTLAK